jgi:hypothetical protein
MSVTTGRFGRPPVGAESSDPRHTDERRSCHTTGDGIRAVPIGAMIALPLPPHNALPLGGTTIHCVRCCVVHQPERAVLNLARLAIIDVAGTGLAGMSAVLAFARLGTGEALVFAAVAVVSAVLAVAVLRAARWALWITAVSSGGQIGAVLWLAVRWRRLRHVERRCVDERPS